MKRRWLGVGTGLAAVLLGLIAAPPPVTAQSTEALAGQIAESLISLRGKGSRYKTIAFSQINVVGQANLPLDELIDFATTKILQTVLELDVVNRAQLQRILKEQEFQLSDFVSADEYQELGRLSGVDLFIYGNLYRDTLILKAIDVQNSTIAWADAFPLTPDQTVKQELVGKMGGAIVSSMKDNPRMERAGIKTVSFWNFQSATDLSEEEIIDFLTVAITQDGTFKVVDRNNLKLILGEQALNQQIYFDEDQAKELGGLYGVQAFINGRVKQEGSTVVADFKMTDIHTGKFVWAEILRFDQAGGTAQQARAQAGGSVQAPTGMVLIAEGPFIMGSHDGPVEARPAHSVSLKAFHIDVTEVSNQDYLEFVQKRKHRAPVGWVNGQPPAQSGDLPVVGVTWDDARDYCRYRGKRLPAEGEWEKAARGTGGQPFPWEGKNFVAAYTVTRESGRKAPVPVYNAGKDVSPYGVKFMAGNVREWVNDVFKPYSGSTASNPAFYKERAVRGSSWAQTFRNAAAYFRGSSGRNLAWPDVGFRCAKDAEIPISR